MKLSVTQENFAKALGVVGRVVGSRATLPVLANILIKTEANRIKLSATNLEMAVTSWIGGKVEQDGAITVPARLLADFIASLPSGTIDLELNKTTLKISTKDSQSQINGIDAEEFPTIPTVESKKALSLPIADFRKALAQTVMVASADDSRPVLNGVYIYSEDNKLIVVATDSYRLAEKTLLLDPKKPLKEEIKVIVPARSLQELLRMLADTAGELEIFIDDNQIMFRFGEVELVSRLIDGQFPDYKQLIPATSESTACIETAEFTGIAKMASLFARENAGSVTVKIDPQAGQLQIRSIATQVGENTSTAGAKTGGSEAEVSLNCRYILDGLSGFDVSEVEFAITGKVNPCVLRPIDNKETYIHIIMPLRS